MGVEGSSKGVTADPASGTRLRADPPEDALGSIDGEPTPELIAAINETGDGESVGERTGVSATRAAVPSGVGLSMVNGTVW